MSNYEELFRKIFLDTTVVHCLVRYGEEIFENQSISRYAKIRYMEHGTKNIESLRDLFGFPRSNFRLVITDNTLEEIASKGNSHYLQYAWELKDYCEERNRYEEKFVSYRDQNQQILEDFNPKIGFLSSADRELIFDAIRVQCKYFMTMDEKLLKNKTQIKDLTGMILVRPFEFLDIVKPWMNLL